jgi:tRNA threonylcarbamoyl adenosine modification protein YjeE
MSVRTYTLHESGLEEFAWQIAQEWNDCIQAQGLVVCLSGEMGAGKTTFVRALSRFWGLEHEVCSPSYVLQNIYANAHISIHHWDVYRAAELPGELTQEVVPGELRLIEWGELFGLENNADVNLKFLFSKTCEEERTVAVVSKPSTFPPE